MKTIKASLRDVTFEKLKKKKNEDGYATDTWEKWLAHLVEEVNLHESDRDNISKHTVTHLEPLWMNNFARNLPYILKGKSIKVLVDTEKDKSAIIVGAGPSIFMHNHLSMLKKSNFKGIIVTTDRMLIPLLREEIVPQYVCSIDANYKLIPAFYKHKLVKENIEKIKVILGSYVSPNLIKLLNKIGADVYWFSASGDKKLILLTVSQQNPNGLLALRSAGNTGSLSWIFSWAILKANPTCLIGMDFGYPEGVNLEETPYYSGALSITSNKSISALIASPKYEVIYHPIYKTKARIDPVFQGYRTEMLRGIREDLPPNIQVFNATEGGTLFGEGMECISFKEFLEKVK